MMVNVKILIFVSSSLLDVLSVPASAVDSGEHWDVEAVPECVFCFVICVSAFMA